MSYLLHVECPEGLVNPPDGPLEVGRSDLVLNLRRGVAATIRVRDEQGRPVNCLMRQNLGDVVCGDRVIYRIEDIGGVDEQAVVIALGERDNLLQKTGPVQ